jgi:heme exporter protein C
VILVALALAAAVYAFARAPQLIVDAPLAEQLFFNQKIFYYHVPSAWMMFLSVYVCAVASVIYLWRRSPRADAIAVAAGELVVLFGLIVLTTGPIWGRAAWGKWWVWDARLTSSLLLWIVFLGYSLVRRFGGAASASLAAALALFGAADVPLIWFSVKLWRTLHPENTVVASLAPAMRPALYTALLGFLGLYLGLLWLRARLEGATHELEQLRLDVDDLGEAFAPPSMKELS